MLSCRRTLFWSILGSNVLICGGGSDKGEGGLAKGLTVGDGDCAGDFSQGLRVLGDGSGVAEALPLRVAEGFGRVGEAGLDEDGDN